MVRLGSPPEMIELFVAAQSVRPVDNSYGSRRVIILFATSRHPSWMFLAVSLKRVLFRTGTTPPPASTLLSSLTTSFSYPPTTPFRSSTAAAAAAASSPARGRVDTPPSLRHASVLGSPKNRYNSMSDELGYFPPRVCPDCRASDYYTTNSHHDEVRCGWRHKGEGRGEGCGRSYLCVFWSAESLSASAWACVCVGGNDCSLKPVVVCLHFRHDLLFSPFPRRAN